MAGVHNPPDGNSTRAVTISGTPAVSLRPVSGEQSETTTALAASATYTGASRDHGTDTGARPTRWRWTAQATAATVGGTSHLYLDESLDGTTWRTTQQAIVPVDGNAHTGELAIGHLRYWRVRMVNGTVAQTALLISGLLVRGDGSTADTRANLPIPLTPHAGTALAASGGAAFTGPTFDLGVNHQWDRVRAYAKCDQTANLFVDESPDGSTWYPSPAGAVAAAGITRLEQVVSMRYQRVRVVGTSATAATALVAGCSLVSL